MKSMKYSLSILLLLSVIFCIRSQNMSSKSSAQQDWEHLDYMKNFFCKATEGCTEYDNLNMLETMRYVDRLYTNRSKIAEAFLENHPNDPHYDDALVLFFSSYFTPKFIPDSMAVDKKEAIIKLPTKGQTGAWSKAYRLMPVDMISKNRWINKGNDIIADILNSNASMERKAKAEILKFNRDYGLATHLYFNLPIELNEQDYWDAFAKDYFMPLILRLEILMETYPDSEAVAKYIQRVLDDMKRISSGLVNNYMDGFLLKWGKSNPLDNRKGIKALIRSLTDNIAALETFDASFNKPMNLVFTAMDGHLVDLTDLRGKVVLINFWSTTCPACIAAMPKLKNLYDKFRNEGFEIIGIADDGERSKENVLKILNKANATWPQRLDKGSEASVNFHTLYQINVLPTNWIVDSNGMLAEKNVKTTQLESVIRKYLNLK